MAESVIDLVRTAETVADETLRAAQREAAEILGAARAEAERIVIRQEDNSRADAAALVANARTNGQTALSGAADGLSFETKAMAEAARAKQGEAVRVILEALV